MQYDLGYFDDETCRLEPIDNPFGSKVLSMSPERTVTHVSGMDKGKVEAPPGFEPGVEVLQSKQGLSALHRFRDIPNKFSNPVWPPLAGIWPFGLATVTIPVTANSLPDSRVSLRTPAVAAAGA